MRRTILLLIFITILQGCSGNLKNKLEELGVLPKQQSKEYLSAFIKATKSYRYYDQFETKSIIKVTYFSEPFINAYLKERKKFMNESEYQIFSDKELQIKRSTIRFFVSLYTPDPDYANLKSEKKIWDIYIENDRGQKIYPQSINKVSEPYQVVNYYFPTLDTWATPYYITFEKENFNINNGQTFKLIFKSVFSNSVFTFQYE
ncbi:MAG: hypothetical protein N2202_00555 [Proteobacteria bacterium]|nr:hypothetical protein [Pseudomonadota bacterium]